MNSVDETAAAPFGKYLTFNLCEEQYGLEILKVREIIGMMDITPVPQTRDHVRGVINLRGKIIPVIDLRTKFGMPQGEDTEETCIIVVEMDYDGEMILMSIIVDSVSEVMDIEGAAIEEPLSFGAGSTGRYILGFAKVRDTMKILLDVEAVLKAEENIDLPSVGTVAEAAETMGA